MKSTYKIDPEQNLIIKEHHGDISVNDEVELLNKIIEDPAQREGMNSICDFTDATMDWNLGDIDKFRLFVAKMKKHAGKSRWAIIFPRGTNTSTIRLVLALHNSLDNIIHAKLFYSREEAMVWINETVAVVK